MRLLKKLKEKTLPYISIFSIIINILQPFALVGFFGLNPSPVHAQEATESAEIVEPSPEPTIIVEPSATPSPLPEPQLDPTLETEEVITEEPQDALPEPDLEQSPEVSSAQTFASVTTDKADYAPTDTVLITANDLTPSTIYTLRITSLDPPAVNFETEVSSDENGSLFYAYQLDGIYRPDYSVEILLAGSVVVSTTFTDGIPAAIYTSLGDGTTVNQNTYDAKQDVYLNGGPQNEQGSKLTDGTYYYQVTTPNNNLLSIDPAECRQLQVINGVVAGATGTCKHANGSLNPANGSTPVQLIPYNDTTNPGGTYKVWLIAQTDTTSIPDPESPIILFEPSDAKTDNFKVLHEEFTRTIQGTKYYDTNANGLHDYNQNLFQPYEDNLLNEWTIRLYDENWNFVEETITSNLGNQGQYRFEALPGNYYVCEAMQPEWTQTGPILGASTVDNNHNPTDNGVAVTNQSSMLDESSVCWQIELLADEAKDGWLKFGNIQYSSLTVIKDEVPELDTDFTFLVSGPNNYGANFSLSDDGIDNDSDSVTLSNLLPGEYNIFEANSAFPYDTSYSCNNGLSGDGYNITFPLAEAENVTCTFTNTLITGFLQGRKYNDDNMNGVMEQGEEFLGRWTVNLYDSQWGYLDSRVTGHTGNTGQYRFDDLAPGTYYTCEVLQDGWSQTGPNLGAYPVDYDNNPLYGGNTVAVPNASGISGEGSTCWQSTINGNDIGWLGLGNIQQGTIRVEKLINPSDSPAEFEFTTNYDDNFFIGHGGFNESGYLNPGDYSVEEIVPVLGWADPDINCSSDSRRGIDNTDIDLQPGENITCVFTNTQYSSISGYKYEDTDGVLGGDITAVLGWDITLWLDDQKVDEASTDASGYYEFTDLLPGNYVVKEVMKSGWINVLGTNTELDVDLSAGEEDTENDFVNTQYGSIQGRKYNDVNGNGDFDQGEKTNANRLDNWNITLYTSDWTYVDNMLTGDDGTAAGNVGKGQYRFVEVYPGTYHLCETLQTNWIQTEPTTKCHTVEVESGEAVTGVQFGNFHEGYISGHKWNDLNGDGIWGNDEFAIPGWRIYLDRPEGNDIYRTTNGNGYYSFGDLGPGNYVVYEENQPGWTQTAPASDVFNITMTSNGRFPDQDFGNVQLSDLHGYKWHDRDNDTFEDFGEERLPGWTINLYEGRSLTPLRSMLTSSDLEHYGWYWFKDLLPGNYRICEELEPGWIQTFPTNCHLITLPDTNPQPLSLVENFIEPAPTYNFGNVELGSITVHKIINPEVSSQFFTFELGGDATDSASIAGWGSHVFEDLLPGEYSLEELVPDGWYLDYASCDKLEFNNGDILSLGAGEDIFCTFHDVEYGEVIVTKYDDVNGNGERDREEALSDWEMILSQREATQSATTQENGQALFDELIPGYYELSEILQDEWTLTNISCSTDKQPEFVTRGDEDPPEPIDEGPPAPILDYDNNHGLFVYAGQTTTCEVGNQADPVLTIEKSNDASGAKSPGDTVEFTITVELTGSNLNNVEVTDLPATGFDVQAATLNATKNGSSMAVSMIENYESPGKWDLGNMEVGDIITLSYEAIISTDQDRGLYKDVAWAQGTRSFEEAPELTILALGQNSDYVDGNFVGTEVEVDFYDSETTSVNIEKEGDVLGASTLPATGANTGWTFLALALMALGGLFMTLGGKMRKGMIKMLAIVFAITLISNIASTTYAAVDVDSTLSVRVEQPKSPTREDDWYLAFTVLDLDNDTPTVNCFVKKPSASSFTLFDSPQVLDAGGNNGSCHVTSSIIGEEGTYEFYISANSGGGDEATDIVSVEYANLGPAAPENYSKDHPSFCRWVIKFKTANDGKTVNVEIYSSTSTSFSADGGTRVGSISIGPDQDGEFIHDRAGQCDQEWYYVIRAFDSIGNGSGLVGDSVVISPTVVEETTTDETVQAIPVSGSILGSQDAEQDEAIDTSDILGEAVEEEGTGLISSAKDAIETATKGKNTWWTIFAILVAGLVSYGFYTRYKAKKDN